MGKGRKPCCDKGGVKKGAWSEDEDLKLISFIQNHGHSNWRALPKLAGLARCGKSCRLRWVNYLQPDIKRGNFTAQEEDAIIKLHETLGNRWSKIASHFPGRTDNEIKNVWNTHLKKRIKAKEISTAISEEPLDMTSNEQQLDSPSTSCCSQASFSDVQINDFNSNKDAPDIVGDVGVNVNEIETDLVDELLNTPFEPNFEWWDLINGDYNSTTQSEVTFNEHDGLNNPISACENSNSSEEGDGSWWWLVYLENELGLLSPC